MENLDKYLILGITIFMIISFLLNKVPYGVTTMTCCALLVLIGYYDVPTAFSGLSNKTTILVAGMFTLAYAFGKTSLISKIRKKMSVIQGKSGFVLLISLCSIAIILAQLMGRTAIMSIMIMFLTSLDENSDITPSRLILPILSIVAIWSLKVPMGMGATLPATYNAMYEGIAKNQLLMLGPWDIFKVSIIPAIALTIFALFGWRLLDKQEIDRSQVREIEEAEAISKRDEAIIDIVFIAVMLSFAFGNKLGQLMYVAPVVGVLVLIYTRCLTVKEAVNALTGDMVWMIAGVLVVSDALGSSGVADLIGQGIISVLGEHPSSIFVLGAFTVTAIFMTTFMSNTGSAAVLIPIGASYAISAGMDPRGIVIAIAISSVLAIAFPSGSAECALTFAAGRYNPIKTLKYTIPYLIIATISLVISANMFFPVW